MELRREVLHFESVDVDDDDDFLDIGGRSLLGGQAHRKLLLEVHSGQISLRDRYRFSMVRDLAGSHGGEESRRLPSEESCE
ncbi:MAG: hypothetical protein CL908_13370 [Deltaproteobacteria bacterium]|nr:hypothetical protein [Deltaproteobacteria bacterium]